MQTWGGKYGYSIEGAKKVLQELGVENPKLVSPDEVTVPPQYPDIPQMREMIAAQLCTMLISDVEVGQIIQRLKDEGHWGNTIIFLLSDHGALFPRAKQMCYAEGLHVPLIVAAPGMADLADRIPPGTRRTEQSATLDVGGSSLHLAGIEVPDYMDTANLFSGSSREYVFSARDRCEWVVDRVRSVIGDRFHYIKNFMTDRPVAQPNYRERWPAITQTREMYVRGDLTPAQAAAYGPRPAEELYDLEQDPHELVNLASEPEHGKTLETMRALVDAWIEETDDKGQYPESPAALRIIKNMWPQLCTDPIFEDV